MSEAQRQLWTLDQLDADAGSAYRESICLQIDGPLDVTLLERAIGRVLRRHEALRTVITKDERQLIMERTSARLERIDLSILVGTSQQARLHQLLGEDAGRRFDLRREPAVRFILFELGSGRHLLAITAHHLFVDGWSMAILVEELVGLYDGLRRGVAVSLPEPTQPRHHQERQQARRASAEMRAHEAYWLGVLEEPLPVLELPTRRPRPAIKTFRGGRCLEKVDDELQRAVRALGARSGCSPFITLLSLYTVLLHRLTGQDDLVLGVPVSGRTGEAGAPLIGYCTHLLPIRSRLDAGQPFSAHLRRSRDVVLDAYDHQDYPFARLLEKLQLPADPSRTPLVSATFNLDRPAAIPPVDGMAWRPVSRPVEHAAFDLTFNLVPTSTGLVVGCDHNADLIDAATARRWTRHFLHLVAAAVDDPEHPVGSIDLLGAAGRHQLLVEWNDTQVRPSPAETLAALFERQVERSPQDVALRFRDTTLTYRELDERASRLAHRLGGAGVRPGTLAGLLIERRPAMLVAMLAILKAGAAYVPLDPTFPADRLQHMIADSGLEVLLAGGEQAAALAAWEDSLPAVLDLDGDLEALAGRSAEGPSKPEPSTPEPSATESPATVAEAPLAYLIYSSASTGKPKGIRVFQRSVVNFLEAMARRPGIDRDDVVLAVTTISFDISILELFLPLVTGAQLVLADAETARDGRLLAAAIEEHDVTLMQGTPATWRLLLHAGWTGKPDLEALCGGEALPGALANRLLDLVPSVWNMYGPTETTVWSAVERVTRQTAGDAEPQNAISIGSPIDNTQLYVLDERLESVPIGVTGELYIGGAGLAEGYHRLPAITASSFLAPGASPVSPARLYRTGDLVRWLESGRLEYLGRRDHQVKVRGFRIELGEIETLLEEHPAVAQAVVVAREDQPGNPRLVAYLVGRPAEELPAPDELHVELSRRLPDYMLPSAFVTLKALPQTANGKVDRRALPPPDRSHMAGEFVAPRSATEKRLAAIWSEVLGDEQVGVHDSFIELGGTSLAAAEVLTRIREELGPDLPLRDFFAARTLAGLASLVEATTWAAEWRETPDAAADGYEEILL